MLQARVLIEDPDDGFRDAVPLEEWPDTETEQIALMEQRKQVMLDTIQYAQDHPEDVDTPQGE